MRDVAGHAQAQARLARAVASGQVSHAYLLTGPESIGKTTLALAVARLLLCERPNLETGDPCDSCDACRKVLHGNHPDVMLVEPEDGKRLLGVDVVRESVVRHANLAPSQGRWRVFILPDVERMTPNTLNALLKTLEEPPAGVVLLLTSTDPESLLPTLISRCQLLSLHPLAQSEIERLLIERHQVAPAEAQALAALAQGRPGWAVRAHEHPELREERKQLLGQIIGLPRASRDERLRMAGVLAKDGDMARRALDEWTLWWRDVLLAAAGADHLISDGEARREAERLGRAIGRPRAEAFLHALLAARELLDQNVNARLAFDVLMFDLPAPTASSGRR